jgi:predicted house-cleaning noncanonical NTP pyrophosphatase (MazG superfamily)
VKLVRDCIPDIIEDSGKSCKWRWVSDHKEHIHFLKLKILEETSEFIENPCLEEAADMLEVVKAFIDLNGFSLDEVMKVSQDKASRRGGFKAGVILEEVLDEKN